MAKLPNQGNYQKDLEAILGPDRAGGQGSPAADPQLLRALQQLCAGISVKLVFDYRVLL